MYKTKDAINRYISKNNLEYPYIRKTIYVVEIETRLIRK